MLRYQNNIGIFFAIFFFAFFFFMSFGSLKLLGKKLEFHHLRMEVPQGIECRSDDKLKVVTCTNGKEHGDLFFSIVIKKKGLKDSVEDYFSYLKENIAAKKINRDVAHDISVQKFTRFRTINGVRWVDSLHQGSEIRYFFTRYFVTVLKEVAIGVTYGMQQDNYKDYLTLIEEMVKSFQVVHPGGYRGYSFVGRDAKKARKKYEKKEEDLELYDFEEEDSRKKLKVFQKKRKGDGDPSVLSLLFWPLILVLIGVIFRVVLFPPRREGRKKKDNKGSSE